MKPKILTVDDSKTIRLIVQKAFKSYECEVFEGSNGVEGLAVATREKPDIIILDLTMPVMDGVEMLSKLKSNPDLKGIPVIMLTAEAGRENVLKIAKMGVRDYLIKPFKEDLLTERVGRIIELKPKGEAVGRVKRFDDPLQILVIDDKPAIHDQIREGLNETPWTITGTVTAGEGVDHCSKHPVDLILVSLSLPENAGFNVFPMLRAGAKTKTTPIFALCVKTAADDQNRAQQAGFSGIITKPIDFDELKSKISRTLNLDTSYKYFETRSNILVLKLPSSFTPHIANEVSVHLRAKISEAVDSGLNKMVVDMSQIKKADVNLIKLGLTASQLCSELSLKQRMVGSEAVCTECKNYEESKDWKFESSFEDAVAALNGGVLAAA